MRDLCGPQVANKVNKVWGLTEQGDLNSIFRDCGHDGLWFALGTSSHTNLAWSFTFFDVALFKR
ncbi:hypothetical protein JVT61DRAFT_11785 [Boletus reticuloceps]|uniref:Uncharacterized protein n=1 Tax=Boletus reticuloceps TaxID=495285 RepID=A0A8I3AEE9_9AGAM|nr:hypothetical protein JVT61DRAFT_11785 [Boletus reticuloceps]